MNSNNTIVAISTATGSAGIGIIRMSGKDSFKIIKNIFIPKNKDDKIKGYTMKYGNIVDGDKIVDEVLVSYFVSPKSYTKEDMCEINSHGGMVVEREILELCLKNGAELANPGEFTQRAFLNGRIDLTQAEAIMDLIKAKGEKEAEESVNQLKGALSNQISKIEGELLSTITSIEVTIDYPEYDIEEVENRDALKELLSARDDLIKLKEGFNKGKILKDGIKTVILGRPNAGKSSLLNTILREDRAIVSNIEGTTRDTIEECIDVNGITLKIIDTAGIRKTENEIEKIGVEKAKDLANSADLIIAIFDISRVLSDEDLDIIDMIKDKNAIIVLNKSDIMHNNLKVEEIVKNAGKTVIKISAKNGDGIDELYNEIERMFDLNEISSDNNVIITNERHKNQINKAISDIEFAIDSIKKSMPIDMTSIYIRQTLIDLGEITGKNVTDDIINNIFKNFCLGK